MSEDGFSTPEEAARGEIPARFARALATAVSPDERVAVVILGTNEEPHLYPYVEMCHREGGRWYGGTGSNGADGIGWSSVPNDEEGAADEDIGVLRLVGEAPAGAVAATVAYRGERHRVPVSPDGYFIFAAWEVPGDAFYDAIEREELRVVRYLRADGSEMAPPRDERAARPELRARMRELMQRGDDTLPFGGVEIVQTIELKTVEPQPEDAA